MTDFQRIKNKINIYGIHIMYEHTDRIKCMGNPKGTYKSKKIKEEIQDQTSSWSSSSKHKII